MENLVIYALFVCSFPFFLAGSIVENKRTKDQRMLYISISLLFMALSSVIVYVLGEFNPFARLFSLFCYGFAGVLMFKGATEKRWQSVDMMLLMVFILISSVIGAFITFTPHSIVMPSAFIVFAGFIVMAIRYAIVDEHYFTSTCIAVLSILTLIDSSLIGTKELHLFLMLKMIFIIIMEIALIVSVVKGKKRRGEHVY